jgi:hypothetical protein
MDLAGPLREANRKPKWYQPGPRPRAASQVLLPQSLTSRRLAAPSWDLRRGVCKICKPYSNAGESARAIFAFRPCAPNDLLIDKQRADIDMHVRSVIVIALALMVPVICVL